MKPVSLDDGRRRRQTRVLARIVQAPGSQLFISEQFVRLLVARAQMFWRCLPRRDVVLLAVDDARIHLAIW
jgi:hypothetical protein